MILILTKEDKDGVKIDQFATSFSTRVPCQQCAGRKQGGSCQIVGSFHHLAGNSPPNPAHLMMPSRNAEPKDQVKLLHAPEMFSPLPTPPLPDDENHPISGRSPPVFLPRKLTEGCRLHGQVRASESSDTYAWAVMSVGPDALLFGESIIAMLGLAPTNPTRMFVATPRRTRRKLPNSIKVEWLRGIKPTATYNGIPCQSAQDA